MSGEQKEDNSENKQDTSEFENANSEAVTVINPENIFDIDLVKHLQQLFFVSIFIVAEIGINHNGDIKIAKELILAAKKAGANSVKFQKRQIDLVYTKDILDKYRESPWGTTTREQKNGLEFGLSEYKEIQRSDFLELM